MIRPHALLRSKRRLRRPRQGAAVVESAIVLAVCLVLLLGMMDLSVAILRSTVMSDAARRITRAAIVRGASATDSLGTWGPAAVHTTASSQLPVTAVIHNMLTTIDPAAVTIDVEWPDGGNRVDQRVTATVRYRHHPIVTVPGWYTHLDLTGSSTMRIAH